jgi:hypothetical protein
MNEAAASGYGLGSIIALIVSAVLNKSLFWAFLHFLCGWFYLVYVLIYRVHEVLPAFKQILLSFLGL